MKTCLKFLTCFAVMACALGSYTDAFCKSPDAAMESSCSCQKRARERALEINAAMDATFPLLVPATADEGAAAFASFFATDGVFQSVFEFPGGIARGPAAIFDVFKAYADNPGEMNQHVIVHKTYWDAKKATLTVERTWYATLTVDTSFCGTVLPAGTTYSQDDAVIIRFACDSHCHNGCVLPCKVVYYNEYFNTCQFESNFTSDYPPPCHDVGERK